MAVTRITWPFFSGAPFAPLFAAVAATTHFGSGPAGLLAVVLGALGAPLALPMYGTRPWNPYTLIGFIPVALIGNRLIAGLPLVRTHGSIRGIPVRQIVSACNSHSCRFDMIAAVTQIAPQ